MAIRQRKKDRSNDGSNNPKSPPPSNQAQPTGESPTSKDSEEEVNQQHPERLNDEVGIEMTASNAFVNPFYTNSSPEEKSNARPNVSRVLQLVLQHPRQENNKEKRSNKEKRIRLDRQRFIEKKVRGVI